jgi:hypothetical protein
LPRTTADQEAAADDAERRRDVSFEEEKKDRECEARQRRVTATRAIISKAWKRWNPWNRWNGLCRPIA